MNRVEVVVFAMLCVSVGACASTDSVPGATASDDCFNIRQINNWDALDEKHVYLEEAGNDAYLLTLFSSCPGLKFTQAIALSNHMGRVCPSNFGRVTYRDAGSLSSCQIDNVERVASKEAATALVKSRTTEN